MKFRIVELDGNFTIEREFEVFTYSYFLFWRVKEHSHKVWKRVTKRGEQPVYIHVGVWGYDTFKDILPPFNNLADAEKAVRKFTHPPKPIYHYQ